MGLVKTKFWLTSSEGVVNRENFQVDEVAQLAETSSLVFLCIPVCFQRYVLVGYVDALVGG